ncbi:hypothetical protein E4N04_19585 [Salmonella enterica]|nr:hypothetical protein [Salmonella enterica]
MTEPARWGTHLRRICGSGGTVTERDSQLDVGLDEAGHELFGWLCASADSLITSSRPSPAGTH